MKGKILTMLLALITAFAVSAEATFQVIPPRNVIAGNRFMVKFRVVDGNPSTPQAPAISGCKLLSPSPGRSTMQSMQVINGQMTSSTTVEFSFSYRAEKEGTFTIPASSITVDGKRLTAKAQQFKVLPADKNSQRSQAQQQGWAPWDMPDDHVAVDDPSTQTADKNISKDDIFVRIILNKSHAYEQEAIECTIKLYTKYQSINSFMAVAPPSFDGFLIEEVDVQGALNNIENYNGQNYLTAVLKKCIIFPQKSGKLTINSGRYDLSVVQVERVSNGWYYSARPVEKKVVLQPYSSTITITPLPEPRPAGFTNAVGKFNFESKLTPESFRTGEAASLSYIITGTGNIKYINVPKPELPAEFEQYSPKSDSRARVSGTTVTGTLTTEYTFVPQSVGDFKIPAQTFVYFNPATKQYVTLSAPAYELKVAKGSGVTTSGEQHDIQAKNTDILHIRPGADKTSREFRPVTSEWWYWSIYGLLALALAGAIAASRRNAALNADVAGRRLAKANKTARRRLKKAETAMRDRQPDTFYQELLSAVWGYLSDKLNIPGSQLNRQNIVAAMQQREMPAESTDQVIALLDQCEMARYTPGSADDQAMRQTYDEATATINALEKLKIKRVS